MAEFEMKYLTHQELAAFEEIYLYLVDCSWFHFPNLWHQDSRDYRVVTKDYARRLWREFAPGRNRLSRKRVSFHESGHSIALAASFREMESCVIDIKGDPGGVVGRVKSTGKDVKPDPDLFLAKQPLPVMPLVRIDIIFSAGGFCGEGFMCSGKSSRAYHELLLVYLMCRYLDSLDKPPAMTNWRHFTRLTEDAIERNKFLFHEAVNELLETSQLSTTAMQQLHRNTKRIESSFIFY